MSHLMQQRVILKSDTARLLKLQCVDCTREYKDESCLFSIYTEHAGMSVLFTLTINLTFMKVLIRL